MPAISLGIALLAVWDEISAVLAMTTMRVIVIHAFLAVVLTAAEFTHLEGIAFYALSLIWVKNVIYAPQTGGLVLTNLATWKSIRA